MTMGWPLEDMLVDEGAAAGVWRLVAAKRLVTEGQLVAKGAEAAR